MAQATRYPKDFHGGYSLQSNKPSEEDAVWVAHCGQERQGVPRITIYHYENQLLLLPGRKKPNITDLPLGSCLVFSRDSTVFQGLALVSIAHKSDIQGNSS